MCVCVYESVCVTHMLDPVEQRCSGRDSPRCPGFLSAAASPAGSDPGTLWPSGLLETTDPTEVSVHLLWHQKAEVFEFIHDAILEGKNSQTVAESFLSQAFMLHTDPCDPGCRLLIKPL